MSACFFLWCALLIIPSLVAGELNPADIAGHPFRPKPLQLGTVMRVHLALFPLLPLPYPVCLLAQNVQMPLAVLVQQPQAEIQGVLGKVPVVGMAQADRVHAVPPHRHVAPPVDVGALDLIRGVSHAADLALIACPLADKLREYGVVLVALNGHPAPCTTQCPRADLGATSQTDTPCLPSSCR